MNSFASGCPACRLSTERQETRHCHSLVLGLSIISDKWQQFPGVLASADLRQTSGIEVEETIALLNGNGIDLSLCDFDHRLQSSRAPAWPRGFMPEELFEAMHRSIVDGAPETACDLAEQALAAKIAPLRIANGIADQWLVARRGSSGAAGALRYR